MLLKRLPIYKIKQKQARKLKIKSKKLFSCYAKYTNAEVYQELSQKAKMEVSVKPVAEF